MAQPGRDGVTLPSDSSLTGKSVDSFAYQYWDWNSGNSGNGALVTRWSQASTIVDSLGNPMQEYSRTGDSALQVTDMDTRELLSTVIQKLDTLIEIMMEAF